MSDYVVIEGIKCYAPSLAQQNEGFNKERFEELFRAEERSFWFRARNKIILFLFAKHARGKGTIRFLEIGCGTGFVLKAMTALDQVELMGSEIYLEGLQFAKQRLPSVELIQMDALHMPFTNSFDAVGAFDVLEHIHEDEKVMEEVCNSLRNDGLFLITVPQYRWMWSAQDDHASHKRRYKRSELVAKMRANGFAIEYIGSFVFTLFPFMVTSRLIKRKRNDNIMSEFQIPGFLNSIFYLLMKVDFLLIRLGLSLPWGGSLICVGRKKK